MRFQLLKQNVKQMIKIVGVCCFLVSVSSAQTFHEVSGVQVDIAHEAWLQLKCNGAVTPADVYPPIYQDIATLYLKVNASAVRPTMKQLTCDPQYQAEMSKITQYCTNLRWSVQRNHIPNGEVFLDWGTDLGYNRIIPGEVFVPMITACRAVGQPCGQNTQCCGYNPHLSMPNYCNSDTNACASSAISTKTAVSEVPASI